jgi:thymidylate synthase
VKTIQGFCFGDFELTGYNPHPVIKADGGVIEI